MLLVFIIHSCSVIISHLVPVRVQTLCMNQSNRKGALQRKVENNEGTNWLGCSP